MCSYSRPLLFSGHVVYFFSHISKKKSDCATQFDFLVFGQISYIFFILKNNWLITMVYCMVGLHGEVSHIAGLWNGLILMLCFDLVQMCEWMNAWKSNIFLVKFTSLGKTTLEVFLSIFFSFIFHTWTWTQPNQCLTMSRILVSLSQKFLSSKLGVQPQKRNWNPCSTIHYCTSVAIVKGIRARHPDNFLRACTMCHTHWWD